MGLKKGTVLLLAAGLVSQAVYLATTVRLPWWRYGGRLTSWSDILGEGPAPFAACLAGVGVLTVAYLVGWRAVRGGGAAGWLVWSGPVVFAATLFWLLPITADLFVSLSRAYLLTDLGVNPLLHAPAEFPGDRLLSAYRTLYAAQPAVYGPAWVLFAAPATVSRYDVAWGLFYLKGLAVVAFWGSAWLLYRMLRRVRPAWAQEGVYLFAWNPLVLVLGVGDGHNDLVMMAVVLWAFCWLLRQRWVPAFGGLAVAVWIKYVAVVVLPLFILYAWQQARRCGRNPWLLLGRSLGAVVAVSALFLIPLGNLEWMADEVRRLVQPLNWQAGTWGDVGWTMGVGLSLFAVAYAVLVRQMAHGSGSFQRLANLSFVALLLLFVLGVARSQPWHLIWLLALAGLVDRRWVWWAMVGLSAMLLAAQVWVEWGAPGLEILS